MRKFVGMYWKLNFSVNGAFLKAGSIVYRQND